MERKDQEINARKQDAITDSKTEPKTALRDVSSKRFYNEVIGWGRSSSARSPLLFYAAILLFCRFRWMATVCIRRWRTVSLDCLMYSNGVFGSGAR